MKDQSPESTNKKSIRISSALFFIAVFLPTFYLVSQSFSDDITSAAISSLLIDDAPQIYNYNVSWNVSTLTYNQTQHSLVKDYPSNRTAPTRRSRVPSIGVLKASLKRKDKYRYKESFSACILIKDENHRLPEWLAYHYFALPLRHLVVLVDPDSTESPGPILRRWRPLMDIRIWNDTSIQFKPTNNNNTVLNHRKRQIRFYQYCTDYMRNNNRTWTTYHDVDEYIRLRDDAPMADKRSKLPGHVLTLIQDPFHRRKTIVQNKSAICILVNRRAFGANDSPAEVVQESVPIFLNATQFETLRFRFSANRTSKTNGSPKGILNTRYVPNNTRYVPQKFRQNNKTAAAEDLKWVGIHRLIEPACSTKQVRWRRVLLVINHYRGAPETYFSRQDARRTKNAYELYQREANDVPNNKIIPWIQNFVDQVGERLAEHLLQGVGEIPSSLKANASKKLQFNSI